MPTIKEWELKATQLKDDDLDRMKTAIETLNSWGYFKREMGPVGTGLIENILKHEAARRLDPREMTKLTFTVVDSWSKSNRTWTWDKLAALDRKGRKMMDATLTAAFAQMVINDPGIKNHIITV